MQKLEKLNVLYLPNLIVYIGKNLHQSKLRIIFGMKWDYYANSHIICIIYAKFEKYWIITVFVRKIMSYVEQNNVQQSKRK